MTFARAVALPERLTIRCTSRLLTSLTSAWQAVGQIDALTQYGLSHYARQRCSVDGRRERLYHLVSCADRRAGREEIEEVLAGSQLVGIRSEIGPRVLAAGAASIALEAAARGEKTTPSICAAYIEIASHPDRHGVREWQRYSGTRRAHLLDLVAKEVRVPCVVAEIYDKVAATAACTDPILRAGALWHLLRCVYNDRVASVALAAIVYHELVAGALDPSQSFSLQPGTLTLHHDGAVNPFRFAAMRESGDMTELLEGFVSGVSLALSGQRRHISDFARGLPQLRIRSASRTTLCVRATSHFRAVVGSRCERDGSLRGSRWSPPVGASRLLGAGRSPGRRASARTTPDRSFRTR